MKLIILFSGKKHEIACTDDTVESLSKEIASLLSVPASYQKLVFKGKSLQCGSLTEQGVKDGAKIMLIGSKEEIVLKEEQEKLDKVSKELTVLQAKLSDIQEDWKSIENGFVREDIVEDFVKSLTKKCLALNERGQHQLEELDSLVLGQDATKAKERRKSLVEQLHSLHSQCDSVLEQLVAMTGDMA